MGACVLQIRCKIPLKLRINTNRLGEVAAIHVSWEPSRTFISQGRVSTRHEDMPQTSS